MTTFAGEIFSNDEKANFHSAAVRLLVDINQAGDPAVITERLLNGVIHLFGCQAAALMVQGDGYFNLVVKMEDEPAPNGFIYADLPQGGIEVTCQNGTGEIFSGNVLDENSPLRQSLGKCSLNSLICVPLRYQEKSLGILAAVDKHARDFSQADLELLKSIAAAAAGVLHKIQQTQRLKIINAELEANHWQLQNSRNILDALFNSIPVSVYIIDSNFELVSVNVDRATRANQSPASLIGKRCYQTFYQLNDICPGCKVMETLFGSQTTMRIYRIWSSTGEAQEWDISSFPIYSESKNIKQAILFEQDVTEKRRLEATLVQSEKLSAVGQLAAGVAHEISNPLSAIIANAQLLQHELPPDDDKQELADMILRAGERAAQVVRNLLDLIRKERYEFVPTDVNETLEDALALVQHEFISRSVTLTRKFAKKLPPIQGSSNHLQGIWLNIVMNALDAIEEGHGEVKVESRRQGNEIHVIITDTGKGMAAEQLNKIFEPFYTTKAPGRGTGLGLSVVQRVIKQHGGYIQVNSQPNVGTEFLIVLPINS